MRERINVSEWAERFLAGQYDSPDIKTQIEAGWYDWFCRDGSLAKKTQKMGNIVRHIRQGGKIDVRNDYVWFKNNCPMSGPLYDDFRFADLETGEVQMTIQIDCCWNKHRYSVWGRRGKGKEFEHEKALFETDSVKELKEWLNEPWEEEQ